MSIPNDKVCPPNDKKIKCKSIDYLVKKKVIIQESRDDINTTKGNINDSRDRLQ